MFAYTIYPLMKETKGLSYQQRMIIALKKLPNPIFDKRHDILIHFIDDRARSNESRFDHIIDISHELNPNDIKRIPKGIKKCIFKKDKERTKTFSIYIKRYNYSEEEYIKISVRIEPDKPRDAIVKTIFITKNVK